jgi:hypothetical protein
VQTAERKAHERETIKKIASDLWPQKKEGTREKQTRRVLEDLQTLLSENEIRGFDRSLFLLSEEKRALILEACSEASIPEKSFYEDTEYSPEHISLIRKTMREAFKRTYDRIKK